MSHYPDDIDDLTPREAFDAGWSAARERREFTDAEAHISCECGWLHKHVTASIFRCRECERVYEKTRSESGAVEYRCTGAGEIKPEHVEAIDTEGLAALVGKWPGDETDDEVAEALEDLS